MEKPQGPSPHTTGGFYVSIRDGNRFSLALGPFEKHARAKFEVDRVRRYVTEHYSWSSFWTYGTSRIIADCDRKPGKLNQVLFS